MEGDFALGSVAAHVCFEPRLDVGALFLVEPFGLLRAALNVLSDQKPCLQCQRRADSQGGKDKEEADADDERNRSFDDENPAPAIIPSKTIHCSLLATCDHLAILVCMGTGLTLSNRRGQQSTKRTRQGRRAKEKRETLLGFLALVPHSQKVEAAREHAAFKQAQEETRRQNTGVILR